MFFVNAHCLLFISVLIVLPKFFNPLGQILDLSWYFLFFWFQRIDIVQSLINKDQFLTFITKLYIFGVHKLLNFPFLFKLLKIIKTSFPFLQQNL